MRRREFITSLGGAAAACPLLGGTISAILPPPDALVALSVHRIENLLTEESRTGMTELTDDASTATTKVLLLSGAR
jgi:hypothetical protein